MFSHFFIDRPIFATVLSIVITLGGGLALYSLPLAMYPPIAPPTVQVDCKYPGASAQVVAETVAAPIEQQVNGVEGMLYMSSQCTNDGSYNLTVTFEHGMDLNMAQVLVQNRVSLALPLLPDVIKQAGVTARKRSPDILMAIAINSPNQTYDQLYLSNYAAMHLRDEIARMPGVSDVSMLGQQDYSMRVWVDPEQLASRNMTALDVVTAIRAQNKPVAMGQVGQPPIMSGQMIQFPLDARGRLVDAEQFGQIVVKTSKDGRPVRLKDVARVQMGAKSMDVTTKVNGRPSISMAIFLLPDANALECADLVKAKMAEMAKDFPPDMAFEIRYDTTPFIRESIDEVFKTLRDAVVLVAIVVLLFLQNWRSAIIPLVAVPVAIVGTFAIMAALGFSLNNLTLFGLVLAIGIVVDDAIVVVEAVEHHMEEGLAPRDATFAAMREVSGPVVAIGLVLSSVFVPCAFISGIVGQFFRQFALTIATSTLISVFNSLTLSPALAAMLLKPKGHGHDGDGAPPLPRLGIAAGFAWVGYAYLQSLLAMKGLSIPRVRPDIVPWIGAVAGLVLGWFAAVPINWSLRHFFAAFNVAFRWITGGYIKSVGLLLRGAIVVLGLYVGLLYITKDEFESTPTGFIPSQDMGYLLVNVQLPDSASLERTQEIMNDIEQLARTLPGVRFTQSMTGQSLLLSAFGSNFGSMFIILDEFGKRKSHDLYGEAIRARLQGKLNSLVPEAIITVLGPPPVRGVGRAGGFKVMAEDRGDLGSVPLMDASAALAAAANDAKDRDFQMIDGRAEYAPENNPNREGKNVLAAVTSVFRAKVPQLYVDVDRREAMTKHVELRELFSSLQVFLGSLYVNDFNLFGRTWQVIVQADSKFRNNKEDVARLKVRNSQGQMVPLGAIANVEERNGPLILTRYNMYTSAPINGAAPAGVSSGDSIRYMEAIARSRLPGSMKVEWTELAYLELQAGNTAMIVFGFAVVMVFLVLAAQYESWALPLAVILVVPLCLFSAIRGVNYAKQDINIFTQIGFVVLVGLACKNAILIVEFARAQRESGHSRREATLSACRLRLRPIVMTSMAFILGVVPLLFAHGAGAEMRKTLGTTVFSGMLGVTVFGLLLTPVFFFVIDWLSDTRLFHSPLLRKINRAIFGVLSMRYARDAVARVRQRRQGRKSMPTEEVVGEPDTDLDASDSDDGHADANGNGHAAPRETTAIHHSPDQQG